MSEITIVQIENQLVVDSQIIAEQLGIVHKHFVKTIRNHKAIIEANFGVVSFDVTKPPKGTHGGRPETFCWLTESQATFLMTLSRNTPKVIACKVGLVKAFDRQKKLLEHPIDRALFDELANRVTKLEATPQHKALPKASVDPVPGAIQPLTERQCITRLIRGYVRRYNTTQIGKRETEQSVTQWMYRELKYRHKFDAYARLKNSKYKRKIDLIEAEDMLPQLHAICNHFLNAPSF